MTQLHPLSPGAKIAVKMVPRRYPDGDVFTKLEFTPPPTPAVTPTKLRHTNVRAQVDSDEDEDKDHGPPARGVTKDDLDASAGLAVPVSPLRGPTKTIRPCKSQPFRTPKAKAKAKDPASPLPYERIEPPSPLDILPPDPGTFVQGYYAITMGQEVGVFFSWPEVQARISGVSGGTQVRCGSFGEALSLYRTSYEQGHVIVKPTPNGPFDNVRRGAAEQFVESPFVAKVGESSRLRVVNLCSSDEESEEELTRLTLTLTLKSK